MTTLTALQQHRRKVSNIQAQGPNFERDPMAGFASENAFLAQVQMDTVKKRLEDPRLQYLATAGSDEAGVYSDPFGGFLVPSGVSKSLLGAIADFDPFVGKVSTVEMDVSEVGVPFRVDENHSTSVTGGLQVYRLAETSEIPSSRVKMQQVKLKAKELLGLTYASNTLLETTPAAFEMTLESAFRNEYGGKILDERINGNGVHQYLGLLHSPCRITVAKEGGQTADTITGTNIVAMKKRVWHYETAFWLANPDCLEQLEGANVDGSNGCKFLLEGDRLAGRPLFVTEFAQALGDEGDLICVTPSEIVEGVYHPISGQASIHVRFVEHESAFLFWQSGDVQPLWAAALTPRNGANTLSPIVTLAARA